MAIGFPGAGSWIWMNNASWTPLHSLVPEDMGAGRIDNC
jgi:hypothetical protein